MREIKNNQQKCNTCETFKDFSKFTSRKNRPNGISAKCKECSREANNIKTKNYRKKNKEKISQIQKRSYEKNREKILEKASIYREENRERIKEYFIERYKIDEEYRLKKLEYWKNKDRKETARKQYLKNKDKPDFKINKNISKGINKSLKSGKQGNHWEDLVGYTLEDLMKHLEKNFKPGMTWDNYGKWHIDHKKPKSWFLFESYKDEEFKKCWSLDNLQPLWAEENLSKGNRHNT